LFCESCGDSHALEEPVSIPGIGLGVWMCRQCLRANSWPYPIVVAQQAILGIGEGNRAWQSLVTDTLHAHGVPRLTFNDDVGRAWIELNDVR
jgi:hypothetical protein